MRTTRLAFPRALIISETRGATEVTSRAKRLNSIFSIGANSGYPLGVTSAGIASCGNETVRDKKRYRAANWTIEARTSTNRFLGATAA